jgi:hypothetical protein
MNRHCFFFGFILSLCIGAVVLSSCKEDKEDSLPSNTSTSAGAYSVEQNIAASQVSLTGTIHLVEMALDQPSTLTTGFSSTIVTKEKANSAQRGDYPMILTIDFGSDTAVCFDGRYRAGKIKAKISSYWKDSLSVMEIQAINYYFDNRSPMSSLPGTPYFKTQCYTNATINVTYLGLTTLYNTSDKYPTQKINVTSATVSIPYGQVYLTTNSSVDSCSYDFFSEGFASTDYSDDKIMNVPYYEGSATSITNENYVFSLQQVDTQKDGLDYFLFSRSCTWPAAGDMKLSYRLSSATSYTTRIINFGSITQQTCENIASYKLNGTDISIILP